MMVGGLSLLFVGCAMAAVDGRRKLGALSTEGRFEKGWVGMWNMKLCLR